MKRLSGLLSWACVLLLQSAQAESLSLNDIIQQALANSPDIALAMKNYSDQQAIAFEVEVLDNPTVELGVTALENESSRSISVEIEQPIRRSNFGSRQSYAEAIRHSASVRQRAQFLEIVHTITRSYASYWVLQEKVGLLSRNVQYARKKQKLIERAALQGRVDSADAKIFGAEALRLEEQLKMLNTYKIKTGALLLKMAGIPQQTFEALMPERHIIHDISVLSDLAKSEGGIRYLLESRQSLAESRYHVAKQDAAFPQIAPRAAIDHDFDENSTSILLGFNMALPIWDRNNAELARAKSERNLAQRHLDALNENNLLFVLSSVRQNASKMQASSEKYRKEIIPSWREVESILDKKFENGQASIFELYQMRERITDVYHEYFNTYLDSIDARIDLESLIGRRLSEIED